MASWVQITTDHIRKLQPGTEILMVKNSTGKYSHMWVVMKNGFMKLIDEQHNISGIRKRNGYHYEIFL